MLHVPCDDRECCAIKFRRVHVLASTWQTETAWLLGKRYVTPEDIAKVVDGVSRLVLVANQWKEELEERTKRKKRT